jgi:hypothetical protein
LIIVQNDRACYIFLVQFCSGCRRPDLKAENIHLRFHPTRAIMLCEVRKPRLLLLTRGGVQGVGVPLWGNLAPMGIAQLPARQVDPGGPLFGLSVGGEFIGKY